MRSEAFADFAAADVYTSNLYLSDYSATACAIDFSGSLVALYGVTLVDSVMSGVGEAGLCFSSMLQTATLDGFYASNISALVSTSKDGWCFVCVCVCVCVHGCDVAD